MYNKSYILTKKPINIIKNITKKLNQSHLN